MAKQNKPSAKRSFGKFLFIATFLMMIFATQYIMSYDTDKSLSLLSSQDVDSSLVTEALHFVVRALTYSLSM